MDVQSRVFARPPGEGDVARWAASGAMALTGPAGGPAGVAPASLVPAVAAMGDELAIATEALGALVETDALALLGERAALGGLTRRGRRSCGGATELWAAADGWVAVALPRPEDAELVPAWLGVGDAALAAATVATRPTADVVAAGAELGLAVAALGELAADARPAIRVEAEGERPAVTRLAGVRVLDLSSLWAGPLAGHLLGLAGARIVKVESLGRPDGARRGPPAFYDLLHAGHEAVVLDFTDEDDAAVLRRLVRAADVVLEASRPRALAQLGIDAAAEARRGAVWLSITGHGRTGAGASRIAFGDDAAVAGGLVAGGRDDPVFCADAIADPLSGLLGAVAVLECLRRGRSALLDVAMAAVAAWCARAGPASTRWSGPVAPPRARVAGGPARPLGADTDAVVAEWTRG